MSPITLTLKERPKVPLEAETVTPDAFVTMSNEQIRSSLVYHGKRHCRLDDFFEVSGLNPYCHRAILDLAAQFGRSMGGRGGDRTATS